MSLRIHVVSALVAGMAVGFVAGCQTYDFEPVEPLAVAQTTQAKRVIARNAKPNLMLLVDKSGSMDLPINSSATGCTANCGGGKGKLCAAGCPTRWTELKSAMNNFLGANKTLARLGMTTFPAGPACEVPAGPRVELSNSADVDAELTQKTDEVIQALSSIVSQGNSGEANVTGGGTPTGLSIRTLGSYAPLTDSSRDNFILLLTDGLPNCNPTPQFTCQNTPKCYCTLGSDSCTPLDGYCSTGCLDKEKTVAEIAALRPNKIRTIVVGFGADFSSGEAFDTLNAMAEAGGFPLSCPKGTNAECGTGNTCDVATGLCRTRYYQAKNAAELAQALVAIGNLVANSNPCEYKLTDKPSNPDFLTVIINGKNEKRGSSTWVYDEAEAKVTFKGELCARLESATAAKPVDVEFRIVQGL